MKNTFISRSLLIILSSQLLFIGGAYAQIPEDPFVNEPALTAPNGPDQGDTSPDQDDTSPDQDDCPPLPGDGG
ncbi:hypothetical protein CIK05_13840 [Bdellovibrio sp. qaytius]|nr:hypothetical protein CIK05_13840 [Bdellovibrio sp. qaytius]